MLLQLKIENFTLTKHAEIEFSPHLNILTGETGAGKSILIDSIRFVLGERTDQIRLDTKEESTRVEAIFHLEEEQLRLPAFISSYLKEEDDLLILRREYSPQGKSRCWINGQMVNVSALKELGNHLIDLHGQYDHQRLLDSETHLECLDLMGSVTETLDRYRGLHQEYQTFAKRRAEMRSLEEGRERELDLLSYQIKEIEEVSPIEGEEEELKLEHARLGNVEKLSEFANRILSGMDENEPSASSLLATSYRDFSSLIRLDPSLEDLSKEFESTQLQLEELIRSLRDYRETLSYDPERLKEIEGRLDRLELLKRKYGGSISEVLDFFETSKQKYDKLVNHDVYEKELNEKLETLRPDLEALTQKLHQGRKKAATSLKQVIEKELKDLGIEKARFECAFTETDFTKNGTDRVEFMISLNVGQELRELRKIVSAGEVSRVMLAIKKALMKVDPVATLIFDEIDANIGGRLGAVTGKKLNEIAKSRQVILITHLPQIASYAERHFKVVKSVQNKQTYTEYQTVQGEERVKELAQMMSGRDESDISREHAKEMLDRVSKK